MGRDPNMGRQGFMNGSLTQKTPQYFDYLYFIVGQTNIRLILYEEALKIVIPFPSSYLCEMGFSALAFMKDKENC